MTTSMYSIVEADAALYTAVRVSIMEARRQDTARAKMKFRSSVTFFFL